MQKINVDLIRLAVSAAVICAVVGAGEWRSFHHSDQLAYAKDSHRAAYSYEGNSRCSPAAVLGDERADGRSNDAGSANRARSDCAILREPRAGATPPQRTAAPVGVCALNSAALRTASYSFADVRGPSTFRVCFDGSLVIESHEPSDPLFSSTRSASAESPFACATMKSPTTFA